MADGATGSRTEGETPSGQPARCRRYVVSLWSVGRAVQQIPQYCDLRLDARAQRGVHVRRKVWRVIGWQHPFHALSFGKLLRIGASQAEVERWDARLNEKRVILGGRDR